MENDTANVAQQPETPDDSDGPDITVVDPQPFTNAGSGSEAKPDTEQPDEQQANGEDGSRPPKTDTTPKGVQKRISQLVGKIKEAKAEKTDVEQTLEFHKQRADVLETQVGTLLEQQHGIPDQNSRSLAAQPTKQVPNPNDFDDGADDPAYQTALNTYIQQSITAVAQKQAQAELMKFRDEQHAQTINTERKTALDQHWTSAVQQYSVDEYAAAETAARDSLGADRVDQLIEFVGAPSPTVVHHLGTHPDEAAHLLRLITDTANPKNLGRGMVELGRLTERVATAAPKDKAGVKPTTAPPPEIEPDGKLQPAATPRPRAGVVPDGDRYWSEGAEISIV